MRDNMIRFRIESYVKLRFKELYNENILRLFVYKIVQEREFIRELNLKDEELINLIFELLKENNSDTLLKLKIKKLLNRIKSLKGLIKNGK